MKNKIAIFIILIIIVVGVFAFAKRGEFFFRNMLKAKQDVSKTESLQQEEKAKILYWTCSMHPTVKSDKPGTCPLCGMKLIPVYAEEKPQEQAQAQGEYLGCGVKEEGHCPHCDKGEKDAQCICEGHSFLIKDKGMTNCPVCKKPLQHIKPKDVPMAQVAAKASAGKILYYRNPMHPEITSPTFMKDEMGMDYIPVYADIAIEVGKEEGLISRVRLNENQIKLAGVNMATVNKHRLYKQIRATGRIAYDPELALAQEEFLTVIETRGKVAQSSDAAVIERTQDMVDKTKIRLKLLGMSDEEITELEKEKISQGNLILPQDKVWVYADIYEYDLDWVKQGQEVKVATTAYPGAEFKGIIKSLRPVLNPQTRTVGARIEINNPDKKLKPEMYVDVFIKSDYKASTGDEEVLAVPKEAILDTGMRKIVYIYQGDGVFIGREIKAGPQSIAMVDNAEQVFYPVLAGLNFGEQVVTKGNFLIDSQSQLTGGMSVLWGGATEVKPDSSNEAGGKVETQHKH